MAVRLCPVVPCACVLLGCRGKAELCICCLSIAPTESRQSVVPLVVGTWKRSRLGWKSKFRWFDQRFDGSMDPPVSAMVAWKPKCDEVPYY